MSNQELWGYIHAERFALADTWAGLSEEQWSATSWCDGWSMRVVAGHVLSAAEQTPPRFLQQMLKARFNFDRFADSTARAISSTSSEELVRRLRARTTTTNHPPGPVSAMLGEIIVHGEDIRRPLGLLHVVAPDALLALADTWKNLNILVGAKRRIAGLSLRASDANWSHGTGPEVTGPLIDLVLAMVGRGGALANLQGDGVATLRARL